MLAETASYVFEEVQIVIYELLRDVFGQSGINTLESLLSSRILKVIFIGRLI